MATTIIEHAIATCLELYLQAYLQNKSIGESRGHSILAEGRGADPRASPPRCYGADNRWAPADEASGKVCI